MATDDMLADFDQYTGHMEICDYQHRVNPCTRDCAMRLYTVALRLSQSIMDEVIVKPLKAERPPECANHNEAAKRDGNPPWCSWCGWRHEVKAEPARKVGPSADERSAGAKHVPWTPSTGYGPQVPEVHLGPQHPGGYRSTGPFNG